MNNDKLRTTHEKLRSILLEANCPETGDFIIDEICALFKKPGTNAYYDEVQQ